MNVKRFNLIWGRTKERRDDRTDDGTVYAGQPAVYLVRRALAAAVLWPVVL